MIKSSTFILIILISTFVFGEETSDDIISSIVNDIQPQLNITCLCTEDEQCDANTRTCRLTHPDHVCYESWTKELHDPQIQVTAGCIYNEFLFTKIICNNNQTDRYIICCSDKDFCNDRDGYANDIRKKLLLLNKSDKLPVMPIFIIISSLFIIVFFLMTIFVFIRMKRERKNESDGNRSLLNYFCLQTKRSTSDTKSEEPGDDLSMDSSACGSIPERSRLLRLEPRTLTKQITLEDKIGMGGYGCVYRGRWHGDIIAVKIFLSSEEASWSREVEIYKTPGLNHDNILRYIAADNIDISYRIELWLATEYHENGSVYDYLQNHTINTRILTKMIYSIVNGLWILHIPINARNGKVAFAHRDLKTKNILVKKDLSCCIADLGLAVKEIRETNNDNNESVLVDIKANHRVGTIRYMAPEILDRTINHESFDSYKRADIYALGLVFWEILRRCRVASDEDNVDSYEFPYQNVLPNNPSIEQMQEVVCIRKIRPSPSERWKTNPIFDYIYELCQELWTEIPSCRPDIYYIKNKLRERFESIDRELSGVNIESLTGGAQTV